MPRLPFREQVLRVREEAIVAVVNRLLADKGFDRMTVDEVAADVGIAKASLYKHFPSKEALAAAAMVQVLRDALSMIDEQAARTAATATDRLQAVVRWALERQLAGQMPSLPAQHSSLRDELLGNKEYLDLLMQASEPLGAWILQAQAAGTIAADLPAEVVLYRIYASACDPVPAALKAGAQYSNAQIVDWMLALFWNGLRGR